MTSLYKFLNPQPATQPKYFLSLQSFTIQTFHSAVSFVILINLAHPQKYIKMNQMDTDKYWSFCWHKIVEVIYPRVAAQSFTKWQSEFRFFPIVHNFNDDHIINHLEPCPHLLNRTCADMHGKLFIEFFIREYTLFVDNNKSLLPFPKDLRLFVYFTKYQTAIYYGFRDTWYLILSILT